MTVLFLHGTNNKGNGVKSIRKAWRGLFQYFVRLLMSPQYLKQNL